MMMGLIDCQTDTVLVKHLTFYNLSIQNTLTSTNSIVLTTILAAIIPTSYTDNGLP